MEISNNTNSILNSNLNTNSSVSEEQKDRFDIFLENQEKDKAEKKERSELLGDLEFVSKTGFTKEELARIKELLEELQKQRAESGQAPLSPEEYIQALKQDLQTAIYEVTGKKVDLDNETIQNIEKLSKETEDIYEKYLGFLNKLYFKEVTAQDQGIELYNQAMKVMDIEKYMIKIN